MLSNDGNDNVKSVFSFVNSLLSLSCMNVPCEARNGENVSMGGEPERKLNEFVGNSWS